MQPESSSFVGDRMCYVIGENERLRKRRQQVQVEVAALERQAEELRNRIKAYRNELEFIQRSEDDNSCEWKQLCEARMPSSATAGAFHGPGMPLLPAQQLPLWTPTTDVVDLKDISRNVVNLSALSDECDRKQVQASGFVAAEDFGSPLQSIMNLISSDRKRPAESQNITGDQEPMPAVKRAKSSQKIGLEELRNHTAKIGQHWDRDTKVLRCPVCSSEVKAATARKACQHVVDHFGDKALFPYKCPVDGCGYTAVRPNHIQVHVKNAHKMDWTDGLAAASVHAENKARLDGILDGTHKAGNSEVGS
ncbi:hypothetical protein AAVH_06544 [Aphelenchoides avenae]|nr:hypothetical protein AAVH_06544 [Aphelenchus avenae]